jgi:triphosphoribosyl-dephospho-CoA synthase
MLPIGLCAQIACIWEATARKPGNVHRYRDFADLTYVDLLLSAAAVGPVLEQACQRRVGQTILEAVEATRRVVSTNTNLGILLLLAPLAAVPPGEELRSGLACVLDGLDVEDARDVYRAIRLAAAGGLGEVPNQDVLQEPTMTLREVMTLAADRDLIALQYVNGFHEVFTCGVPVLRASLRGAGVLETSIIECHLRLMALRPDSLIARKRGRAEAEEASRKAQQVLVQGWPRSEAGRVGLQAFDAWLCSEGHSRNPGTTADLVTACLFVLLRNDELEPPNGLYRSSALI